MAASNVSDHTTPVGSESMSLEAAHDVSIKLREAITTLIFGQEELITETLACLLAGGHILLTGAPGLAKTTLVRVFANVLGLQFGRVQFTPDLLPSDILGSEVLNIDPETSRRNFEFSRGPVFTNLLLADEINRASPRTQSALLEAMQERSVTVAGKRHVLPQPFLVFATQNPFESEGTFPLPEAQMDRFLMHSLVDYPSADAEERMLTAHAARELIGEKVEWNVKEDRLPSGTLSQVMERVRQVRVDDALISVIKDLVRSSRPEDSLCPKHIKEALWYGAGPRAGISLISASRAFALMSNSEVVRWQHIKRMAKPVLRHRIRLAAHAMRDGMTEDQVVETLIDRVQAERGNQALGIS
jgi:MoxR-like ATPase